MDEGRLTTALERAERALSRIEQAIEARSRDSGRDEQLRARVREAVQDLDRLIREAAQ